MDKDIFKITAEEYGILPIPKDATVGMAYVPYQINNKTYSAEHGVVMGTMFPVLNKPFVGCGGKRK